MTIRSHLQSINPYSQKLIAEYPLHSEPEIESALARLDETYRRIRLRKNYPLSQRREILTRLAELLDREVESCALLITREMGKPIAASRQEIKKCASVCRYYADHLEAFLIPTDTVATPVPAHVELHPIGIVLAVMPWNFPFWQVIRVAAPQIALGNPMALKHASNVTGCAAKIEELVCQASGEKFTLLKHLRMPGATITPLISDRRIQGVTLTGSEPAGISVARAAAENIKKSVLELGGSDPLLVSSTANIKEAAMKAAQSRLINSGQSCIAAKRFIVVSKVWNEFVAELKNGLSKVRQGSPESETTELGPLQSAKAAEEIETQINRATQQGCTVLFQSDQVQGVENPLAFSPIRLLEATGSSFQEEIFGPVALMYRAQDWDHAIEIANQSPFGLSSSAWTQDPAEAQLAIELLEAGSVFINATPASDPKLPFGGIKRSGYGRELGLFGLREFANIKTCAWNRS